MIALMQSRAPIKSLPSAERLAELFAYDPETGMLTWRKTHRQLGFRENVPAGTVNSCGYLVVGIERRYFYVHRIIWKMMTGADPTEQIDHIDADKLNNRWANLRPATNGPNRWNSRRAKNNRSGVKGVCWDSSHRAWKAYIGAGSKQIRLGRFKSLRAAIAARVSAAEKMHGEFARHS